MITLDTIKRNDRNLCAYYYSSVNQRDMELARGEDFSGTIGYEEAGCYKCDGYGCIKDQKIVCPIYLPVGELEDLLNKENSK